MQLEIQNEIKTGAEKFRNGFSIIAIIAFAAILGLAIGNLGLVAGLAMN